MRFAEISIRQPKSSIKAGEGLECGTYKFFTSGVSQSKFLNEALYHGPALIFGTGGSPSVHYCEDDFSTSTDCLVYYPSDESIDFYCAYLFFKTHMYLLEKGFRGAGLKHIKKDYIENIEINWPNEDRRNVINTTSKKIDFLAAKRKEQLDKLELLPSALFSEMFGDPIENPNGYEVQPLRLLCDKICGGGTPSKSIPSYWEGGDIPWVTSKDMKKTYIDDSRVHITREGLNNSSAKILPVDSILMVLRSGILKHTLPVAITTKTVSLNQDLKAFVLNRDIVEPLFVLYQIKAFSRFLLSKVRAVTADNIEFSIVKNLGMFLPPLPLQQEFAEKVADIEKQKELMRRSLQKLELLKNSLMQQYFA